MGLGQIESKENSRVFHLNPSSNLLSRHNILHVADVTML